MLSRMALEFAVNKYTLVMVGGAFGSLLRYLLGGWGQSLTGGTFPLGTLLVNVLGCLAIGTLNLVLAERVPIPTEVRVGLTVGVLGGFTTFSSFGWETLALANDGQAFRAFLNVLLNVALGLLAVWCGYRLAERWIGVAA